jgi:sugar/nucleoside kinase (ribokinase family)
MKNNNYDAVVIGNVGVDTNVYLPGADIDFKVESNFTENIDYTGQAGGYTSRGFAQLGHPTAFIGYVGDDHNGALIRRNFADDGIDTSGLFIDPAGPSRSINFMYRDGRRKNFYDGKSHMTLAPDLAACEAILSTGRLAHFHIPNWARILLPIARKHGLTISCDIQDVVSANDEYRRDFVEQSDILFFSAVNQGAINELVEAFLAINPNLTMVIGMGAKGCAAVTDESLEFFSPVAMDTPVIDTNGAGDGLAVGFLSSYVLNGHPLPKAIQHAQICARHTCTLKASSDNLMTQNDLLLLCEEL